MRKATRLKALVTQLTAEVVLCRSVCLMKTSTDEDLYYENSLNTKKKKSLIHEEEDGERSLKNSLKILLV